MSDAAELDPTVVIGAGLLGASIGAALTRAGVTVHLSDAVLSHARVAETLGAGTTAKPEPAAVRLVVVATPPRSLAAVIGEALDRYPNAAVTDVGSVKGRVLRQLQATGRDLSRYLGSHPMAGSQHSGPVSASPDLFEDRTWAVTPHREVTEATADRVRAMIRLCGARYVAFTPDEHDRAVAQVSHLPQLVSVLMADHLLGIPTSHLALAGQGLRDVTRIAGSDPTLWEQIIAGNVDALRPELEEVRDHLDEMIAALDDPLHKVRPILQRGVNGTRQIPGKHGAPAMDYARLVIEIPDTPGALAQLFRDIADAGVNIEDIDIQHDLVRQVGYLEVSVEPGHVREVAEAMRTAGWRLS
ncbi:prephenate dehydrogenase [Raineyella sp. W15-4]|uniref:prephenate dehydrogenase n=1 Tax=Raineyella sp. W15-4 TaxID=3081651 RepID=UPI002953E726|nr:prephenate dehydrogenase [Raineyella sp. W15-4]WOQ18771.1 prephenate dehydrogenase [Raineyella sp. W15-4]